jgi:type IV secretory pathway VirB4 component
MTEYFTKDGDNFVKVEEPLHTQSHLDEVVKQRAERIVRSDFGDYDDLKKKAGEVDTVKSEYENKLKEKETVIGDLTGKVKTAELGVTKVKLISEFKLSDDLAEFVTGDTEDEMRQRAEKLAKGIKPGKVTVNKDGKPIDNGDGKQSDSKTIAKSLFGGKSDD